MFLNLSILTNDDNENEYDCGIDKYLFDMGGTGPTQQMWTDFNNIKLTQDIYV